MTPMSQPSRFEAEVEEMQARQKRPSDELVILERYVTRSKAPGVGPSKLAERLAKARALLEQTRNSA